MGWVSESVVFCPLVSIAFHSEETHVLRMTSVTRRRRLCGWSIRSASVALALLLCASAFADPSKKAVVPLTQQAAQKGVIKVCYVRSIASGVPEPCDRLGMNQWLRRFDLHQ